MITVENLDFSYPNKKILHDVSFSLVPGSITALVGPNGAGKTTLLRCLAALERNYSGKAIINGIDVAEDPRQVHSACGYLSDNFGLYESLNVRQCLTYAAWCHNIPPADVPARVEAIARKTGITEWLGKNAGVLSRGYRQRLGIGLALIHNPRVLILDEPASGMDPEARIGLSALMKEMKEEGKTIIVSSHILNELEDYCTDMLVIRDGRISDHVKLREYAQAQEHTLRIGLVGSAEPHLAAISAFAGVAHARLEDGWIVCGYSGDIYAQQRLLAEMMAAKIPVFSFNTASHTLQDAYMNIATAKIDTATAKKEA